MVIWALLSVSQVVKAENFYLRGNYGSGAWEGTDKVMSANGSTYTLALTSSETGEFRFRFKSSDFIAQLCPYTTAFDLTSVSSYEVKYTDQDNNAYKDNYFLVNMEQGKTYVFTLDNSNAAKRTVSCMLKSDDNGGGNGNSTTNPLTGRVYTEGYYLVGNFFNFDGLDINYDDAVFKFQQQGNDADGNAVYMVEIPATLTAKAQVMEVNQFGKKMGVYGPGEMGYGINNTFPKVAENKGIVGPLDLMFSETIAEGENYWQFSTRRTQYGEGGQDGSYAIYLTVDKSTQKPTRWKIEYTDLKRVAYFVSKESSSTALTVFSQRADATGNFNSGKYFASLYMKPGVEYYAVTNDLWSNSPINEGYEYRGYGAMTNQIDRPTYNKLFLLGNDGLNYNAAKVLAENGSFVSTGSEGLYTVELNTNKGVNDEKGHGGVSAEIIQLGGREHINSISMVGDAIPGTTSDDGTWIWNSTAGDMAWDENDNCYKLTLVTTAQDNGSAKFRFVGNHKQAINWHENTKDDASEKARIDYDSNNPGHAATAADPNEVCYTQSDEHDDKDYHIIWNRDANRWTVRFYIYTYTVNDNPAYKYYYTITENHDLELRDFGDVVYKSEDNVRKILYRGDYRYFRTWSGKKAWKVPNYVDVYVVSGMSQSDDEMNGQKTAKYTLTKLTEQEGGKNVIPANTGVILAVKDIDLATTEDAVLKARKSLTSYNTLVIPMEAATKDDEYTGSNLLRTCVTAQNIPTFTMDGDQMEYNYLFGFYHRMTAFGIKEETNEIKKNQYIMGFWISGGSGSFYSNSAYLPVGNDKLGNELNMLGTSYQDFDTQTKAKKVPALFFDFAHVDDDNHVTGIQEIPVVHPIVDDNYYTLSGLRVSHPAQGGIYIHHGKKVVIK